MQFIKPGVNINFIGKRKIAFMLSIIVIFISLGSLLSKGIEKGVDFAGGTLIQIQFPSNANIDDIKSGLKIMGLNKSSVQQYGEKQKNEYLIRTNMPITTSQGFNTDLETALESKTGLKAKTRRVEMVGPQIGKDIQRKAYLAIFYALILLTIYISGRFELKWMLSGVVAAALIGAVYILSIFDVSMPVLIIAAFVVALVVFWFLELKYAMGAIVALMHDIMITTGIFSILGIELTLPIVAALLTIIGYSLNDTIIVFDRIRENLKKYHKNPLDININKSINETLNRTILTSLTTLGVVVALFTLGGSIIHDFAFAMIIGVLVGTYSSIFVASPILLTWQERGK